MILLEIKKIIRRKEFKIISAVCLAAVILDFLTNCYNAYGGRLTAVRPAYVMTVLDNYSKSPFRLVFEILLPLLITVAASDMYYSDYSKQINTYILSRVSRRTYIISQAMAVFVVTFGIVFVSVLLSIALSLVAFPMNGYKTLSTRSLENMIALEFGNPPDGEMMLYDLYMYHPYLNLLAGSLLRALAGGVFALLAYGFSFLRNVNRYMVFFSAFILFNVIDILYGIADSIAYSYNRSMLHLGGYLGICLLDKNPNITTFSYFVGQTAYIILAVMMIKHGIRKEEL